MTLSGMYDLPPVQCSLNALGRDHVMLSADYPVDRPGCEFLDTGSTRACGADIATKNAAKLLGL